MDSSTLSLGFGLNYRPLLTHMQYDDLIIMTQKLLKNYPELASEYDAVLVDELQVSIFVMEFFSFHGSMVVCRCLFVHGTHFSFRMFRLHAGTFCEA